MKKPTPVAQSGGRSRAVGRWRFQRGSNPDGPSPLATNRFRYAPGPNSARCDAPGAASETTTAAHRARSKSPRSAAARSAQRSFEWLQIVPPLAHGTRSGTFRLAFQSFITIRIFRLSFRPETSPQYAVGAQAAAQPIDQQCQRAWIAATIFAGEQFLLLHLQATRGQHSQVYSGNRLGKPQAFQA